MLQNLSAVGFFIPLDKHSVRNHFVRIAWQRQRLRRQSGTQQITDHVTDIARTMERHAALQRGRQLVQLPTQTGLECDVVGTEVGTGRNHRLIFRVQIASPVDVIA